MEHIYIHGHLGMSSIYIRLWTYTTLSIHIQKWRISIHLEQADW